MASTTYVTPFRAEAHLASRLSLELTDQHMDFESAMDLLSIWAKQHRKDFVSLGVPVQYIQGGCFIHKSLLPRVLFLLASRLLAAHDAYIKEAA